MSLHYYQSFASQRQGLDNISAKLLRECPDVLAESLTHLFNQSIMTGIFPDEWKSARVTPLYKQFWEAL